jgi:hypothetical protein
MIQVVAMIQKGDETIPIIAMAIQPNLFQYEHHSLLAFTDHFTDKGKQSLAGFF